LTFTPAQFLAAFVLGAVAGTAVFFHAERNHIKHSSAWASFVFLALLIGLPSYVVYVRRTRRRRM
jgi:Flp pilus assembly protein TadB